MRGTQSASLKNEGKNLAEQMGYHWTNNTDPSIRFDGLMYRPERIAAVKLKKIRYGVGDDCFAEDKFPDDVADLRDLPLPSTVIRELWVRTQNERAYRRFIILPGTTVEIEENTAEKYRNTHYREEYWKKAPYSVGIPLRKGGNGGDEVR